MGPTASGKTWLAERLADQIRARLLNADAFQVYRGFDIGTAKPPRRERYALVDILDPHESFGVGEFVRRASLELADAWAARQSVVVVGGTGLYVRALFEGWSAMAPAPNPDLRAKLDADLEAQGLDALFRRLVAVDPESAAKVDPSNPARVRRALERALEPHPPISFEVPPFAKFKLGLKVDPALLDARIESRIESMLAQGWVAEVESLLERGVDKNAPAMRAIGYGSVTLYCRGAMDRQTMTARVRTDTRKYAKRQRTWLRKEPELIWLNADEVGETLARAALSALTGLT